MPFRLPIRDADGGWAHRFAGVFGGFTAIATLCACLLAAWPARGGDDALAEKVLPVKPIPGDDLPRSLTRKPGDAVRGRALALDRERGNCILCHVVPSPEERLYGNLGPSLEGIANRLSDGQMRQRLIDGRRLNPDTIMPSYLATDGLTRVAKAYQGKSVLTAAEIEDLIAYLQTLTGPP